MADEPVILNDQKFSDEFWHNLRIEKDFSQS